ncbi:MULTISPECIES: bifunctional 2-C-methyl-D-erythritol 4-phosphate cytidylyltransferase IspD/2-C-methyl-D-erythritol 2,4-cyclodiphosphate synthase [Deferrisoma]
MRCWGVVAAGGAGRRMGAGVPKQFLPLAGEPVLAHTLRALAGWPRFAALCVAAPADALDETRQIARTAGVEMPVDVVPGGAERGESVLAGLRGVRDRGAAPDDLVFVHDGARPFPPTGRFDRLAEAARPDGALLAVPVADTLKRADDDGRVEATVPRAGLWRAQTPQVFPLQLLFDALTQALTRGLPPTDEAGAVEALGRRPRLVEGDPRNLKITFPEDLGMAEALLAPAVPTAVGHGYDVHRLVEGRRLVLGGVEIPYDRGLLGHSDADVLAHAVGDAVLGACGLGDLGRHFPDSDPRWKDAPSLDLLGRIGELAAQAGYRVLRVDATLVAQRPKVAAHVARMEANLSGALGLPPGSVTVKATTTEGLGFEGRGEGISAHAVALVTRRLGGWAAEAQPYHLYE